MRANVVAAVVIGFLLGACGAEKKANKAFTLGKYETVINYYKSVVKKQPNNGVANYYIAESYRQSNRIQESEPYYAKAGGKGVNPDSVKLYYAKALQSNAKYAEAREVLQALSANTKDEKLKDRAGKELAGIDYLDKLSQKKSFYKIKNMEAVNTPFTEYAPVYSNNQLYFTSSRANAKIYEASGTPFTDLYVAETNGANVNVNTIAPLPDFINAPNINEGTITFTPDGKTMIFGKGNSGKRKGTPDVDLYLSRYRNGAWEEPIPLNINQPDAWESTPALAPDGRTLYFSSNRKGGFGGLDLYSAQMDGRGRFSRVRNLGPEINSAGSELFPHVADNGKLYFSSDGHPGYGMLDIFVVNRANGKTVIENLGQPVNSPADDFGIHLFKADRGFFTSNREGGKGDDDIYTFINEDPNLKVVNYYLAGVTYLLRRDSAREILPNTKVTLLDQEGEGMQEFVTGNDGKFLFRVYENENYTLIGETDGFITKRQPYTTVGKSVPLESLKDLVTNITLDTILVLDRKEKGRTFVLNNIYFEYNESYIRADAAKELDKLVTLLNDNPDLKIEMGSHTDSVASDAYNIELSQRRAESTVSYLIKKGIDATRLEAKGYGESKPIARNTNPDGSDNPTGRQRNRRTEFKILEIGTYVRPDDSDEEDRFFRNNELKKNE
jgi:peptidoglycan-associated lipoprotein